MSRILLGFVAILLLSATTASAAEIVRYRLPDWKAKHLHDATKADKIAETLKKLGCEVTKADHNGHIDVKYRCPEWRQLSLDTQEEAQKWEAWFKEFRFQTERKR